MSSFFQKIAEDIIKKTYNYLDIFSTRSFILTNKETALLFGNFIKNNDKNKLSYKSIDLLVTKCFIHIDKDSQLFLAIDNKKIKTLDFNFKLLKNVKQFHIVNLSHHFPLKLKDLKLQHVNHIIIEGHNLEIFKYFNSYNVDECTIMGLFGRFWQLSTIKQKLVGIKKLTLKNMFFDNDDDDEQNLTKGIYYCLFFI